MTESKTTNSIQPSSLLSLLLLAVFAIFFLSSCATLKKGDCIEGNWSGIGFNDATAGLKSGSQFSAHTKACSKHKITPNKAVYDAGYQKGLVQFCTSSSGYNRGVNKSEYYGICPATTQKRFLKGYVAGLDTAIIELNEEIANLKRKRRKTFRKYLRLKHHSEPDTKKIKTWSDKVDSIESSIESRRSDRKKLRRWHDFWATKLR